MSFTKIIIGEIGTEKVENHQKKYKVLVFGNDVFGSSAPTIISDLFSVTFESFPNGWTLHNRLSNYSLVILDYSAFNIGCTLYKKHQEIFEKELLEALDKGTNVCFLYYDNDAATDKWDAISIPAMLKNQIGYKFICTVLQPVKSEGAIHAGNIRRGEFKTYHEKWGSGKITFFPIGEDKVDDTIVDFGEGLKAFSVNFNNGIMIYLPCQRNFDNKNDIINLLKTLIDNIITYVTKINLQVPKFAIEPLFTQEKLLNESLLLAKKEVVKIEAQMQPFQTAKTLAFASDYRFEDMVPKFLKQQIGLITERNEKFSEDFWILDFKGKQKTVICETKSYVKGFKRAGVHAVCFHRESNDLDDTFPAIVFVNQNLNAPSWKEKETSILPQDYKVATDNNVLIVRAEDLLYMWDKLQAGKITKEEIYKLLTTNKGWLYFKADGSFEIKQ